MANHTMRPGFPQGIVGQRSVGGLLGGSQHRPKVERPGLIPRIEVLAHGDAIEANGPHHGAAMVADR